MDEAEAELERFLAKFDEPVAAQCRGHLATMRARLPTATILVYDNYNALAIGFGPDERPSHAVLSLAVFPRWVTLCFLNGAGLDDPAGLLRGSGSRVRHVRLIDPVGVDSPPVEALIGQAVAAAVPPFDPQAAPQLIIRSVSAKQRPRRPAAPR